MGLDRILLQPKDIEAASKLSDKQSSMRRCSLYSRNISPGKYSRSQPFQVSTWFIVHTQTGTQSTSLLTKARSCILPHAFEKCRCRSFYYAAWSIISSDYG